MKLRLAPSLYRAVLSVVTLVATTLGSYSTTAQAADTNEWTGASNTTWTTEGTAGSWADGATYQDGNKVIFGTGVSGTEARKVTVQGTVAPGGVIEVNTGTITHNKPTGKADSLTTGTENGILLGEAGGYREENTDTNDGGSEDAKPIYAYVPYGYVIEGGTIADYGDLQTSITKSGEATLVLNSTNTFSGGVNVENGALYLGAEGAAGTGTITLNTDAEWNNYLSGYKVERVQTGTNWWGGATYKEIESKSYTAVERRGAELIVDYTGQSQFYVANITNSILLDGEASDGQGHISFGYATYGDSALLPCEVPRNVVLSGGVFGSGELHLHGYSYADKPLGQPTENYVSTFTVNKSNLKGDSPGEAFSGTVYLKNAFNESVTPNREHDTDRVTGGAVQLNLSDDVFANATINLTRDQNKNKTVGWDGMSWWGGNCPSDRAADSQTSDNILVLDNDVTVKGLDAGFLGSMWWHEYVPAGQQPGSGHNGYIASWYMGNCEQARERWRVRVVTSSEQNVLTLGNEQDAADKHIFSGVVGFKQSYVDGTQTFINDFAVEYVDGDVITSTSSGSTPPKSDASFAENDTSTLGKDGMSLVKNGEAIQYIHSANLRDITLVGGTLGFNHLSFNGTLNMNSGTELKLGVTTEAGWDPISANSYDYATNDDLTIGQGKYLVVNSYQGEGAATVTGNVNFTEGANLQLNVMRDAPGTVTSDSLLSISGALTLQSDTAITLSFDNVSFASNSAGKTYYLVEALGGINIGTGDVTSFSSPYITLGSGYYGKLGYINNYNNTSADYLTLTVVGDPRRTWSGHAADGVWKNTGTDIDYDSRWKEKLTFKNGQMVLFGNLYDPTTAGVDSIITSVVGGAANPGCVAEGISIDGESVTGFQHVKIEGEVAPISITINADYTYVEGDNGTLMLDGTNYYFSGGVIRDMVEGENFLGERWPTALLKQGTGTAIIATNNAFSGGSLIEGGRLVMQHVNALGSGDITIQNGAILQGDFQDATPGTTTILNDVTVNHITSTVDARLKGPHNRKLVLNTLFGERDSVLELVGSSLPDSESMYTYGVFEVLNAGGFSGRVQMAGYLRGETGDAAKGGNVQLEITAASSGSAWTNATIDLSLLDGTNRTVLALNPDSSHTEVALSRLVGTGSNSSVVNTSANTAVTLHILGSAVGAYDGAIGYGDYLTSSGAVGHYSGNYSNDGTSAFNVKKSGNAAQTVGSAWLDTLDIDGGTFAITEDLVVKNIDVAHGTHLIIGETTELSYGLTVGMGGYSGD
ncbi:MAG: autotransporter-associated beta strand repeat-containing protein [Akkermansia sp.]|nr:autotransporter-associated beta strand repeat-containing protein [Akkermansia sp.]